MHEEFLLLRDWLDSGGPYDDPPHFVDRVHRRLGRALSGANAEGRLGSADLVALIAHALRHEAARAPHAYPQLRVPAAGASRDSPNAWPTRDQWESASLGAHQAHGRVTLTPQEWTPTWLSAPSATLTHPLFAEEPRRTYEEVAGDPFLQAVGLTRYRCDAQREAVRAVLSVPDGRTIVVNLPTGAGKSLCAQLPAMLRSQRGGISIVVVPTTALALDQERAMENLVAHKTAYVGGDSVEAQERRQGIRARVRDGSQRIVFTSPESLLGSLRPAVYDAARNGLLRLFVVDEAHMVEQWGDEFRSSFQELGGLRTDLKRQIPLGSSPFTTVLLTATLTDSAFDTLETLFGGGQALVPVSAAQLRPEPSYWAVEVPSEETRAATVLEAMRHLPRPLMLYLTEPIDADRWALCLGAEGYRRLDVVSGRTSNVDRARVIRRWHDRDTDVVVATSAFGLGVDQGDVRVVLHGTLPENVDRFYQEVGRGGRDGRASASLVIYTPDDVRRAKSMNRKKIIGIKRGHERWSRMFEAREVLEGDRVRVPIDTRPNLSDGIEMDNDLNRAWNVRTLTLMSRARLIEFDAEPPPRFRAQRSSAGEETGSPEAIAAADVAERSLADAEYDLAFAEHQRHRVVSLRHHGTVVREVWEQEVEPVRRRTAISDYRGHLLMLELLRGSRCAGDTLAEAYGIPARAGERPRSEVAVAPACGGCAHCRQTRRTPYATPLPTPLPRWPVEPETGPVLDDLRGAGRAIAILYNELPPPNRLARLLRWLVGQGIRVAALPATDLASLADPLYNPGADGQWSFTYALETFRFMNAPALPAVVLLPPSSTVPRHIQRAFERESSGTPVRVLLAPADTPDATIPRRLLRSALNCRTFTMDEFSLRVGL